MADGITPQKSKMDGCMNWEWCWNSEQIIFDTVVHNIRRIRRSWILFNVNERMCQTLCSIRLGEKVVMARAGCSWRSTRTIARRLIMIMTIICVARHHTRGFHLLPSTRMVSRVCSSARRCRTLLKDSNIYSESMSVPTVVNPISKRRIHLGGRI